MKVPYPSTNNQPNPSVTAILGQCMSLSTGTSVSQFVSHPSQHIDMLCMTLGESLTGVSDKQPMATNAVLSRLYESCRGFVS